MNKKKPSKTLSKKTIIQPSAMEPERHPPCPCSAQSSCVNSGTSCSCPMIKAMLEEETRLLE